ncbi:MAG TPA: hypothetical protein VJY40_07610 [Corynebacterium sp.]|nr:hypothetical protein [Corynebacterium sp.]
MLVNGTWIDLGEVVGGPGQPGAPGQSITIVEQYINDEGNTVIVFSDGTEVIVNKGTCETCGLGSSVGGLLRAHHRFLRSPGRLLPARLLGRR